VLQGARKVELLRRVPLFAGCSQRDLVGIARIANEVDFRPGRLLIQQGAPGREFFILIEGLAEVMRSGRRVDTVGPGDFVGEMALVTDRPRSATVMTTSPVRALVVKKPDFRRLIAANPLVGLKVMQAVADRVPAAAAD
jgi:CRP/FNR family transcriptional regulator, cyclic AMP receptor protein